jgi:hypothetical protein
MSACMYEQQAVACYPMRLSCVRVTSVRVQVHARVTSVSLVSVSVSVVVYCMSR